MKILVFCLGLVLFFSTSSAFADGSYNLNGMRFTFHRFLVSSPPTGSTVDRNLKSSTQHNLGSYNKTVPVPKTLVIAYHNVDQKKYGYFYITNTTKQWICEGGNWIKDGKSCERNFNT